MEISPNVLNLFYDEPDPDRWIPFDRYPRRLVRHLLRGKPRPRGQTRVFLNLCAGLDRIGVPYRVNDYRHAQQHPNELVCIVGKPCVLDNFPWKNPILFGAAVYSHPSDDPSLLERLPIKKVLVPGAWMKEMCRPYWGEQVEAWPVGIDTESWFPTEEKDTDVLIYDKVRWDHERFEAVLIEPIRVALRQRGHSSLELRYGFYREEEFHAALTRCRAMIFLCEHETQGIAYQQALSSGIPMLAWDRGGYWQDPNYYPHMVRFQSVSSVPYWDERCGAKFAHPDEFENAWLDFWEGVLARRFKPRDYIRENLTLKRCARAYLQFCAEAAG
jgi:hypothetical protein